MGIFLSDKVRVANNNILKETVPKVLDFIKGADFYKKLEPLEQKALIKNVLSEDASEIAKTRDNPKAKVNKGAKEIFFHFFGMNESWPLGRNILGGFMVHSPEYPTYFIPAYTQAKATGDASELKKGEGPRGLITGGLEGVAVGALVSGRVLKLGEMIPYIFLGAALQLFSGKVFPWIGEKMGRAVYNKNLAKQQNALSPKTEIDNEVKPVLAPQNKVAPTFKGRNISYLGNLKI